MLASAKCSQKCVRLNGEPALSKTRRPMADTVQPCRSPSAHSTLDRSRSPRDDERCTLSPVRCQMPKPAWNLHQGNLLTQGLRHLDAEPNQSLKRHQRTRLRGMILSQTPCPKWKRRCTLAQGGSPSRKCPVNTSCDRVSFLDWPPHAALRL